MLLKRLLNCKRMAKPTLIAIFSRDEAKQHQPRVAYRVGASEWLERFNEVVQFPIGYDAPPGVATMVRELAEEWRT